ncbi:hypothetical protein CAMGR0001_1274 [Campylobacter gracilis RM3268]|uniref:Uncharacterized protein n=1 Tax=Campylobacter gracilis RM3268 TaxID=553220 RepID=C8PJ75_9BACT|nr:hypothetical protein CAMGR0001_1274 [Campylobacter gracilis RM3268]
MEFGIFRILFYRVYRVFLAFYFSRGSPLLRQIAPLAMLKPSRQSSACLRRRFMNWAPALKLLRQSCCGRIPFTLCKSS